MDLKNESMDAMSMSRPWLRRLAPFGLILALVLGYLGVQAGGTLPAHAATNQFHGVNWADPNDNSDIDLCSVGGDSRLSGTLLSIHMYTLGGETHPTPPRRTG